MYSSLMKPEKTETNPTLANYPTTIELSIIVQIEVHYSKTEPGNCKIFVGNLQNERTPY